jgi:hypothetical protein
MALKMASYGKMKKIERVAVKKMMVEVVMIMAK